MGKFKIGLWIALSLSSVALANSVCVEDVVHCPTDNHLACASDLQNFSDYACANSQEPKNQGLNLATLATQTDANDADQQSCDDCFSMPKENKYCQDVCDCRSPFCGSW